MRKTIIISSTVIIIILIAIPLITWFYPYSLLSVHKSYSFKPDPIVVREYISELDKFKNDEVKDSKNNLTKKYTQQFILQTYEQDWLTQDKITHMNRFELEKMTQKIEEAKQDLLLLIIQMDYSKDARQSLVDCFENLSSLEDAINSIRTDRNLSRAVVKNEYHNLYQSFYGSFLLFRTFYEDAQGIR